MKKKSKKIFILAGICAVITVIFVFLFFHFSEVEYDADWGENGYYGYFLAKLQYDDGLISRTEFKEIEREFNNIQSTRNFFGVSQFITGGVVVVLLATGIVFKVKENKEN